MFIDFGGEKQFKTHLPVFIRPFFETSLADNSHFRRNVGHLLGDRPWKRKVSIIAADATSGQAILFDETVP